MKLTSLRKFIAAFTFCCVVLAVGRHDQASNPTSGQVESQIRAFGPSVAARLQPTATFERTELPAAGYRPVAETPRAPAGLKPVEQQAWAAMATRMNASSHAAVLAPIFPERYAQGTEVRGQGMAITLKPLGSNSATARVENGKLVYHEAYAETDSLQAVTAGQSEEFLLLHNNQAPQRFEYEITAANGVKDVTLQGNAIHFKNAKGKELELATPWLVESPSASAAAYDHRSGGAALFIGGHKPPLQADRLASNRIHWELKPAVNGSWPRLALVIDDAKSLHYPVLIDPTWITPQGALNVARYSHTATLLNNGQVLVAGGYDTNSLASAELFDPATGKWTLTASLNTARYSHTATLLTNGEVLVAGGVNNNGFVSSAELYNPIAGTWTVTGSLNNDRVEDTATLLPSGEVLLAGGNGTNPASAELYNPATGAWTVTGSMNTARYSHTAVLLGNGEVLVTGGGNSSGYVAGSELYNPTNGVWTITGNLNIARVDHTATLLTNGQVLVAGGNGSVAGGNGNGSTNLNSAELYNPSTGTWTLTGALASARAQDTATLLPNGEVLVAGGENTSGALNSTELYNPAVGTWSSGSNEQLAGYNQTATLLADGEVMVTGGYGTDGVLDKVDFFDSAQGSFSSTGAMMIARTGHTATLLANGKVLVAGGATTASAEVYDESTGKWTATGPMNAVRTGHTATLLPNGKVLVAGGTDSSTDHYLSSAELYDPAANNWTAIQPMIDLRSGHTATLLRNGQVLVAGGNGPAVNTLVADEKSAELYDPATGVWTATGSLINGRSGATATLLSNGNVSMINGTSYNDAQVESYNPAQGTWSLSRIVFQSNGSLITPLADGTLLILNGSEYFLEDPVAGTETNGGELSFNPQYEAGTLLPSGFVLISGGMYGSVYANSELYNPGTRVVVATSEMITARYSHTSTLLPNGDVLVAGGKGKGNVILSSAELFHSGLGNGPSTQPQVDPLPVLSSTAALSVTGSGFTGVNGDSAGSNIPVVQLQSLANGLTLTATLNATQGFDATDFPALAPAGLCPGFVLATVYVGGTPSVSQIVPYAPLQTQTVSFSAPGTATFGDPPLNLGATASSGLPVVFGLISGPATLSGNAVTFTGVGAVVVQAGQAGNNTYASAFTQQTINVAKDSQTINFPTVMGTQYVGSTINLSATASSGAAVTFAVVSGPATLTDTSLLLTGTGTVVVEAEQAGNAHYLAAPTVMQSIVSHSKISQMISFGAIADQPMGTEPFALGATASSGLTVTYGVTGPATVAGSTITLTGPGPVTVTAQQGGSISYAAATPVTQSFNVIDGPQTITFPTISSQTEGVPLVLSATASSGLPVTYTANGPVSVSKSGVASFTGTGTVQIRAHQDGNTFYLAAPSVLQTFAVKLGQTIAPVTLPNLTYTAVPFTIPTLTSSAGLPVTVSVLSGPAMISGNQGTLTGTGVVTLAANQAGNAAYSAAPQVTASFTVTKANQTIAPISLPNLTYTTAASTLPAFTSSAGLPVTFSVVSGPESISGNQGTLTGTGTVVLAVNQAGNSDYNAAPEIEVSFSVTAAAQTITFPAIGNQVYPSAPISLSATASSGQPVTYSTTGPVSVSGNTLTITGTGSAVVAAHQAGNADYLAAPEVRQVITIGVSTSVTYSDSGNNITGWTQYGGSQTYPGGGTLNPPGGFVPFAGASSNGSVIVTSGYESVYGLPVTASGDFTLTCEMTDDHELSKQFGPIIFNAAQTQFIWSYISDYDDTMDQFTSLSNLSAGIALAGIPSGGPRIAPSGTWHTMVLQRVGSVLTYSFDGTIIASHNLQTISTVGLGLAWDGDTAFQIRNISVTMGTVTPVAQTITFPAIGNQVYPSAPITLSATASSGLPVSYSTTGPVRVSGDTLTITGTGTAVIGAHQSGDATHLAAPEVRQVISIGTPSSGYSNTGNNVTGWRQLAGSQTYPGNGTFNPPGGFVPFAGASSNGSIISTSGYESCYGLPVTASGDFTLSCEMTNSYELSKQFGPIIFNAAQTQFIWSYISDYDDSMYEFSDLSNESTATAGTILAGIASNGPRIAPPGTWHTLVLQRVGSVLTFSYDGAVIASHDLQTISTVSLGLAWDGDTAFQIRNISVTMGSVAPVAQAITFPAIGNQVYPSAPITLSATASSGLPVTYSTTGPVRVSGDTLTITGTGSAVIGAHQSGDATHLAAPEVRQVISIGTPSSGYSNTGNNVTGWTQYAGSETYVGNGPFNPPGGFAPFAGVSSNGSVIATSGYDSFYALPVIASGDFTFSCEMTNAQNLSKVFGPIIFNAAQTQFIWSYISDYDDSMFQFSSFANESIGTTLAGISSGGPTITPAGTWHTMVLQRVGSVLTFSYDGTVIASHDLQSVSTVGLGFAWGGDTAFQIRNISVTLGSAPTQSIARLK